MLPRPGPAQPANVLSHWYVLTEDFQFSSQEFYRSIEDELAARKVPRLQVSRVEYHEGSMLTDKRIYLRLARERYAFDVCGAPFGTGYFFSLRLVEKPRSWVQLAVLLVATWFVFGWLGQLVRRVENGWGWVAVIAGVLAFGFWLLHRSPAERAERERAPDAQAAFAIDPPDLDSLLLNVAVIGGWYEKIRKDTYHRHDTRMLYQTLVTDLVKKKVDEVTSAKGVKLIRTFDYNPILGELYKRKVVKTGQDEEDEAAA